VRPDRLTAFTDGVVAILITILVLELRPPAGDRFADILDEKGRLLAYVLSFVFVAIYWNNHHHLFQVVHRIDGRVLWANMHLLFWLSLTPVATAWLGDAGVHAGPAAAYAVVLFCCGIAYTLLTRALLALHDPDSQIAQAIGHDRKGKLSLVVYAVAFAFAFVEPWISIALFVAVSIAWFVPDRRVSRMLETVG
jgi:TMEM175 potassium channel family protein